jgi:hypothetical protein
MLLKLQEAANYIESPDRETILDPNLQATLWESSRPCHPRQQKADVSFISPSSPLFFQSTGSPAPGGEQEGGGGQEEGQVLGAAPLRTS